MLDRTPLEQVAAPDPPPPPAPLLSGDTVEDYRSAVAQGAERVAARLAEVEGPFTGVEPAELEPAGSLQLVGELENPIAKAATGFSAVKPA